MIKINIAIYIIIAFSLFCCKSEKTNIEHIAINVNEVKEEVKLSEFIDSISFIKLETTPACLLGNVRQVIIKKKYIYVLDLSNHCIYVFDKKGSFVSKLDNRGNGPEEYSSLGPIVVDEEEEYIELFTYTNIGYSKIKYSNIDFHQIDKIKIPGTRLNNVKFHNDLYYFSSWGTPNLIDSEKLNPSVIVIKDTTIIKTLINKKTKISNRRFVPFVQSFSQNNNNELFISVPYDNFFYKLSDKEAVPILKVDFGKNTIDESIGIENTQKQLEYIENATGKAFFPLLSFNSSDIMIVNYLVKGDNNVKLFKKEDCRTFIHLKHSNKVLHTKKIINDLSVFPKEIELNISPINNVAHDIWHNGYLVDIVMPNENISFEDREIVSDEVGSISYNDNPVIVLMKLKQK